MSFFFCVYLNLPKSMILQTGGRSLAATSTRVQTGLASGFESFARGHDAEHDALGVDDPHG